MPGKPFSINLWLSTCATLQAAIVWAKRHEYKTGAYGNLAAAWHRVQAAPVGTEPGTTREDCEMTISRRDDQPTKMELHWHTFVMDAQRRWFEPEHKFYPTHLNPDRSKR
jgi:hypothetical protein